MSELQEACEAHGITITSVHVALEVDPDPNRWKDKWLCTIHYKERSANFDFWTGIGHRVVADGWKKEGNDKWGHRYTGDVVFGIKDGVAKGVLVLKREKNKDTGRREVVGPPVADIISCVLNSTQACTTTFDDWCSNYGENNDSLKALNGYLDCQREGSKLIRLLGSELVAELSEKQH